MSQFLDGEPWEQLDEDYRVDFPKWEITNESEERILAQFRDKVAFVGFVRALLQSCENLTDELTKWALIRTAYEAEDENLNILGRIVGAERGRPLIDVSQWFRVDEWDRTIDKSPAWVDGAPLIVFQDRTDQEYRYFIIAKAIRNHTIFGSIPEVKEMIRMLTGLNVSFIKTAPDTVALVAIGANRQQVYVLTNSESNDRYDDFWVPPYPAGLNFSEVVTNADWFTVDHTENTVDKVRAWVNGALIVNL